jgi:hypothetical protein
MSLVFIKVNRSGVNFLILYVDNILLIRNNNPLLLSVKIWLFKNFFYERYGRNNLYTRNKNLYG